MAVPSDLKRMIVLAVIAGVVALWAGVNSNDMRPFLIYFGIFAVVMFAITQHKVIFG